MAHSIRPDGIEHDISRKLQKMTLLLDKDCLEAALQNVSNTPVSSIESLRKHAVEQLHPLREVGYWGFNEQMIMVVHQTIGMTCPIKSIDHASEIYQKSLAIFVVNKDVLTNIAAASTYLHKSAYVFLSGPW